MDTEQMVKHYADSARERDTERLLKEMEKDPLLKKAVLNYGRSARKDG